MKTDPHFDAEDVRLLAPERAAIRDRVLRARPRRVVVPAFRFTLAPALGALALLAFGSGLTYASQLSGPGDLLHGIELGFVEPVQSALYVGADSQSAFRVARLEERLDELQSAPIAALSADDVSESTRNVTEHAEQAVERARAQEDPSRRIDYLVQVSALLEAHEDTLAEVAAEESIKPLGTFVADELDFEVGEYATGKGEGELVEIVSDELSAAGSLLQGSNAILDLDVQADLQDVVHELAEKDFDDALRLVTKVRVDALTDQYLNAP